MPVGAGAEPPPEPDDGSLPAARAALAAARERGVHRGRAARRLADRRGPLARAGAVAGPRPAGRGPTRTPCSLVALASAGALDVLLTADAESDALARLPLTAGGGAEGVPPRLRGPGPARTCSRACGRAVALISAGEGNPFRHPRPETLAALAAAGAARLADRPLRRRHGQRSGGARLRRRRAR